MDYSKFQFPPYEYVEYPKWVDGVLVQDADEEAALKAPKKRISKEP